VFQLAFRDDNFADRPSIRVVSLILDRDEPYLIPIFDTAKM